MIESDTLLVKCPHCGAWPMAANLPKPALGQREIRFRCTKCHRPESGGGKVRAIPASEGWSSREVKSVLKDG